MGSCSLNAIPVVDASLAGLRIHVKVLQVVVEIHRSSAEIPAQKRCMGCEDGGDIDSSFLRQW